MQLREQYLYYGDQLLSLNRIVVHPHYYTAEGGADVALLELEVPVNDLIAVQVLAAQDYLSQ